MPGSRSGHAAFSPGTPSSSRQFLNMLNPMSRTYQGYIRADATLAEEEDEQRFADSDSELEGRSTPNAPHHRHSAKSQGKRKVPWDGNTSEMNVLRPNIHKNDKDVSSDDDEVPQSFMIEATGNPKHKSKPRQQDSDAQLGRSEATKRGQPLYSTSARSLPPLLPTVAPHISTPPKPSELDAENHEIPRFRQTASTSGSSADGTRQAKATRGLDDYEKALWNWVNVYNLDAFLQEVYLYYEGKGIYSIALSKGLNLLTVGFVIGFSTFLLGCIDYSKFRHSHVKHLHDAIIDRCVSKFSGFTLLFFILFTAFYVWQIFSYVMGVLRLVDMYNFYTHLLKIPDSDIQTISWGEVVRRIGAIREENPITAISSKGSKKKDNSTATAKLDAHDVANRILRQENYLIALFNKELLDLRIPLPGLLSTFITPEKGKGKVLTQALEWNLRFCLMEYLFDRHGRVRKVFLKSKNRRALIEGLQRRFIFMGMLNAIFSPFIVLYFLMYSFFRYFEQFHKDMSSMSGRRYTLYAHWKFREFNELPHIFTRRLDESYPIASMYIGQFPNEKLTIIMRFVAFIAGSFAAVLVLATVLDPDLFLNFEITPHRTVLFYLGVFGAVLGVTRGMIPEENRVFDPELLMSEVITYTHYMPDDWKGELHSKRVHQEFGELFAMKVLIFVQEIISVVLTPFVLWFSLPACAPAIVDFFREFTVHVDGRGYVCSFAEFNFERHGNVKFGAPAKAKDARMVSNEGKMEKSFLHFKAANPDWNPTDPSGSIYLNRMADLTSNIHHQISRKRHHQQQQQQPYAGDRDLSATVHWAQDNRGDYDRALRQSQYATMARRKGLGLGNSIMTMSTLNAAGSGMATSIYAPSQIMAQTAVLGDSQGSIQLGGTSPSGAEQADAGSSSAKLEAEAKEPTELMQNEVGLGDSYVDGAKRATKPYVVEGGEEEEDELEDGGVLGLLAQIYGRRDGPTVGIS
ncbi:APG9-domain-containing protein [Coprinopsis marcescibilis]|uniref:Autophagy-related protein 9 n=1 Tax=Coprinopsis marcescibilis TaxID=230819 RepID=A0A5C3LAE4_COPMA|nr:APG9-domain-containing protein [Coprinopsis marcescibilis]